MREVLFRKEIICATLFSTSGSHIWEWQNETPPNEAMQFRIANEITVVATIVGKIMPVVFPDLTFLWGRCLQGAWQKGWNLIYVSPDGSLRRSADGLVDIHTNPPLSLEIKCKRDSSVFWGSNQAYPTVYVIWSRLSLKVNATYFSVGPRKMVTVKCYVS